MQIAIIRISIRVCKELVTRIQWNSLMFAAGWVCGWQHCDVLCLLQLCSQWCYTT